MIFWVATQPHINLWWRLLPCVFSLCILGMFKYHMTLRGGLLKPSEYRHRGGRWLGKSSYNSGAEKSLIYSLFCSIYGICGRGDGWKRHMGVGVGWKRQNTVIKGGMDLKLLKKTVIWYLNVPFLV